MDESESRSKLMGIIADVIVIGSGPAGVSACFPLLEAGLRVLMLDGGEHPKLSPPSAGFLDWRQHNDEQWRWMIGDDFHALRMTNAVSPKLRVPGHRYVFAGFEQINAVVAHQAVAIGSLASGGLSNAWGCGVAALSQDELNDFPFPAADMQHAYAAVARRIGLSGAADDDLSSYFGVDAWADPPVALDSLQLRVQNRYLKHRQALVVRGFRLGRARLAVLSKDHGQRKACDLSGNCLYGCHRRALYSATEDLLDLQQLDRFTHRPGSIVQEVGRDTVSPWVSISNREGQSERLRARKVLLAAGTLASTRLALLALKLDRELALQSSPTGAFLLWLPLALGQPRSSSFGLGQLSFTQQVDTVNSFGSLFTPTGIPVAEFVRHVPLRRRTAIDFLGALLRSCLVGNLFLPGYLSSSRLKLDSSGALHIYGAYRDQTHVVMDKIEKRLRSAFLRLGGVLLPGSFTLGPPGSDIHYASSLPMRNNPSLGETDANGSLIGLQDIHVIDGACLPSLLEKSHTLTIMANAHRIGLQISRELNTCHDSI